MKEFTSLSEATKEVLFIQDAVNGRAIIGVFPAVMQAIIKFDKQPGTDWYNTHPLVVLMLDKLAQLAGGMVDWNNPGAFRIAYEWAKQHEWTNCVCPLCLDRGNGPCGCPTKD